MDKVGTKFKKNSLFSPSFSNSYVQNSNVQAKTSCWTTHTQHIQTTHGMLRFKMKEMKWEEAYLVDNIRWLLCLFELQKSLQQSFVIFKWKRWSRTNSEGRASKWENAFKLQSCRFKFSLLNGLLHKIRSCLSYIWCLWWRVMLPMWENHWGGGHDWKFIQKWEVVCKVAFWIFLWSCLLRFGHGKSGGKHQYGLGTRGRTKPTCLFAWNISSFAKCMRARVCMKKVCLGHLGKGKEYGACGGVNPADLFVEKCAELGWLHDSSWA